MTINATSQIVYDGLRNVTVKLTGRGDGQDGPETYAVKVDVSELNPPCSRVKIEKLTYAVSYGVVKLSWDGNPAPTDFEMLDGEGKFDYTRAGGLQNMELESSNGDILLSTLGFDLNSTYSILLEMVKK